MDKNTVIGLILMAAVFFGFMWFAPKDKIETPVDEVENAVEPTVAVAAIDSLSPSEMKWLMRNIADNGNPVASADSTSLINYSNGALNLTTDGRNVTGTVTVDGAVLDWNDVMNADLSKMTVVQQRKAIELVRAASTEMGRFGKFAQFLAEIILCSRFYTIVLVSKVNFI